MTNKPSYRFEDYAEPWEQRKLGEIVDITSGDAPAKFFEGNTPYVKVDDLNYCDKYLTATQNHVDTSYKIKKIEKGSVVFPKRGAAILTNKIRILNVQAYMDTNMMSLNTDKANLEFLYTVISNIGLYKIADTSTIPQINNKHILPYPIYFPTLPEQTAIGSFFQEIDQLISLQQRKLEVLKEQKKTYLNLLFPTKVQKKPALRFAGFEDDWKEVKVSDIFRVTRGQVLATTEISEEKTDTYKYPVYSSQTKNEGLLGYYDKYLFETAITWTTDGANAGTVNYREGKFYSTNVNGVLLSDEGFANKVIAEILNNEAWKYVSKVGNPKLMNNVMSEISLVIPNDFREISTLSIFFQDIDKAIAKQEEKVNQLKESKQTLLRKMFI
jgi:hypothetical protein